jgi:hypothetical protein
MLESIVKPRSLDPKVDRIDQRRESELWRDPDRPGGKLVPARQRQNPEVRKAKSRARTAAWRNRLDRLRRPEISEIGMSLVVALVTSPNLDGSMTDRELRFVDVALADLEARGFDLGQINLVLRRLRRRLVNSGVRQVDESDTAVSKTQSTIF